jgi:stage II sporulation SpoAA-like protein
MLNVTLDCANRIAILEPNGALSAEDFANAAEQIDPIIEATGTLNGLIIHAELFPGWDSFGGLISHLKFIKKHHEYVTKVAFVTDSGAASIIEHIGKHFVSAETKLFPFPDMEAAKNWILG